MSENSYPPREARFIERISRTSIQHARILVCHCTLERVRRASNATKTSLDRALRCGPRITLLVAVSSQQRGYVKWL